MKSLFPQSPPQKFAYLLYNVISIQKAGKHKMSNYSKYISTSALSRMHGVSKKELDEILLSAGYTKKIGGDIFLTDIGSKNGGVIKSHAKYGEYIAWPENMPLPSKKESPGLLGRIFGSRKAEETHTHKEPARSAKSGEPAPVPTTPLLNATKLAEKHNISSRKVNWALSEAGFIERDGKGWAVTALGKEQGGTQKVNTQNNVPFVVWPDTILENKLYLSIIDNNYNNTAVSTKSTTEGEPGFREKFPATHRTADGHMVRSKAEMLIDNWFYMENIAHAYEKKLPIEEDVYCDFYIPAGKIYVEFWGLENDPAYAERKKIKQEIYKKYDFNLIELKDEDVFNIDDVMPRLLLKYNVSIV